MDKNESKPGSKILLLFRMMLRYWPYMVAGLVAMTLFAFQRSQHHADGAAF
ncbi:MAG: hypothetical protein LRZ88_03565 [Candidatus Cloacimonetes bacterium]|nr:hypothetical protein [Candidatus Cloacimonadota bacterium]